MARQYGVHMHDECQNTLYVQYTRKKYICMHMYYTMCKYTDMQEATYMLHVNNCTHTCNGN